MRRRLLYWFLVAAALFFALGLLVTNFVLGRQLENRVDQDLVSEIALYQSAVAAAQDEAELLDFTREYLNAPESQRLRLGGMILALELADGSVVSNSADVRLEELDPGPPDSAGGRSLETVDTSAGPYRVASVPIVSGGSAVGQLHVGASVQALADIRRQVLLVMLVAAVAGIALTGLGAWYLLGRALRPVQELTRTAGTISREDISRRIDYSGPRDEIGELAETMNGMLDRLEDAFTAQDRFISDVSHELRTPLTIVKGHLQVLDRKKSFSPDLVRQEHALVLDELDRMNRLVSELLTLSRAKRSDFLRLEPVALDGFLTALVSQGPHLATRSWLLDEVPGVSVAADQDRLTQVFLNLMQNAVSHTKDGDTIALGGHASKSEVRLWVRDTGEGMPPAVRGHVFEQFYRGPRDAPKAESEQIQAGLGLGLAIAHALVVAHGGRFEVESTVVAGSRFTVVLPFVE